MKSANTRKHICTVYHDSLDLCQCFLERRAGKTSETKISDVLFPGTLNMRRTLRSKP